VEVGCFMRFMTALTHGCPITWPNGFPGLTLAHDTHTGNIPASVIRSQIPSIIEISPFFSREYVTEGRISKRINLERTDIRHGENIPIFLRQHILQLEEYL